MLRVRSALMLLAGAWLTSWLPFAVLADDKPVDPKLRYQVPSGDAATLLKFIEGLEAYRPKTTDEILAYRQNARTAIQQAAQKILEIESDKSSEPYRKAGGWLLSLRLADLRYAKEGDLNKFLSDLRTHIDAAKEPAQLDVALAFTFAQILEEGDHTKLAQEVYREFGERFAKHPHEELAAHGKKMVNVARRLGLPGNTMEISGQTVKGEKFDWQAYRGKVVLVDFWATWCEACVLEMPNIKANYDRFHEKGFEVVGISLDERGRHVQQYLMENEIPWTCLFEEGLGWEHPIANHYAIDALPAMFLVDREGKVVATNPFGEELTQRLEQMLK